MAMGREKESRLIDNLQENATILIGYLIGRKNIEALKSDLANAYQKNKAPLDLPVIGRVYRRLSYFNPDHFMQLQDALLKINQKEGPTREEGELLPVEDQAILLEALRKSLKQDEWQASSANAVIMQVLVEKLRSHARDTLTFDETKRLSELLCESIPNYLAMLIEKQGRETELKRVESTRRAKKKDPVQTPEGEKTCTCDEPPPRRKLDYEHNEELARLRDELTVFYDKQSGIATKQAFEKKSTTPKEIVCGKRVVIEIEDYSNSSKNSFSKMRKQIGTLFSNYPKIEKKEASATTDIYIAPY